MAQNNPMGATMAPPPASPANPTALNFQSDPNMRQQFKGFMSGLANRPMPQPMAQPMPAPLPMYTPAANIDIFQPVQGYADGGGVTFSSGSDYSPGGGISISSGTVQGDDTYAGGNDRRDYSGLNDPYEAEMIQTGKSFLDTFGSPSTGGDGPVAFGAGARPRVSLSRSTPSDIGDALSQQIDRRSGYDAAPMDYRRDRDAMVESYRSRIENQGQAQMGRGFGATGATKSVSGYDEGPLSLDNALDIFEQDTNLLNIDLGGAEERKRAAMDSIAATLGRDGRQISLAEDYLLGGMGDAAYTSVAPFQTPDEIAYNDTMMQTDMSPADMQRIGREREAQRLSLGGGQVDVDPVTGAVSSIPVPASRPSTLIDYTDPTQVSRSVDIASPMSRPSTLIDYTDPTQVPINIDYDDPTQVPISSFEQGKQAGEKVAQGVPSGDIVRTEAGSTNRIPDSGFGTGEVTLAAGSFQPADRQGFFTTLLDTMTGRQFPTEEEIYQGIDKAFDAQTTALLSGDKNKMAPNLGTQGAATRSALEQLAERATPTEGGGILGAFKNFGASNAANMYNDIVNRGYEPVYDAAGQIVATRVPGTDILGRGSVEGRIPGRDSGGGGGGSQAPIPVTSAAPAEEVAKVINALGGTTPPPATTTTTTTPPPAVSGGTAGPLLRPLQFGYGQIQGINPNLDTAANKFLSLLGGYAEGGEVKNFFSGGSVSGVSEADEEEAELSEAITGSYTTTGGGKATGFSYDDGGDDNVQATVADGSFIAPSQDDGYNINTTQANQLNQQQNQLSQSLDAAKAQQQQMAPQKQDIRSRIASVAEASTPSFSSMLGDLFSFDAPEGTLSDLERAQLDVRGRMAERGSDYYGQNLPQNVGQSLSQAGMTPNNQYMDVLTAGRSGGDMYGTGAPVGVQYLSPQEVAAGTQSGVQAALGSVRGAFNR